MLKHIIIISLILISVWISYCFATETSKKSTTAEIITTECKTPVHGNAIDNMVWIPGGSFTMGSTDYYPDEQPLKKVEVAGFWIDKYEVTNTQFSEFVDATAYITVAERQLDPNDFPGIPTGQLKPGSVVFIMPTELANSGNLTQQWQFILGAQWRRPTGPDSNLDGKEHHPVVHIAYEDALAYAKWLGHKLPTETQWEYAARGGLEQQTYVWGEEFTPNSIWQANTWQGMFPVLNTEDDGYVGVAPIGCYAANGYGLYDMTGNVWEWVSDWYYPKHQEVVPATQGKKKTGYDPRQPNVPVRVIKGGSYLCAKNYCMRYRPAARHAQETTLGAAHIGFRTVKNF